MFHFHRGRQAPYAEKIVRRSSVDLPAARVLPNFVRAGRFQPLRPNAKALENMGFMAGNSRGPRLEEFVCQKGKSLLYAPTNERCVPSAMWSKRLGNPTIQNTHHELVSL
ncbi:hypothetical protein N7504_004123 [Penicillium tannophilum]|nr:hypothetical protein N7504_004123 [Penicillium tannophilum]